MDYEQDIIIDVSKNNAPDFSQDMCIEMPLTTEEKARVDDLFIDDDVDSGLFEDELKIKYMGVLDKLYDEAIDLKLEIGFRHYNTFPERLKKKYPVNFSLDYLRNASDDLQNILMKMIELDNQIIDDRFKIQARETMMKSLVEEGVVK